MPNFTFKKDDVQVFVVYSNNAYNIITSEISFSQTFQERSFEVKTIQTQGSFEGSVINKANPATFELNIPLLEEATNTVLFDRLVDMATFDLYISSQYDVWKLEKCVIQDGQFEINKSRPLRLAISGEASKLSKYTPSQSVAISAILGKRVQIQTLGNTDWLALGAPTAKVGLIFTATSNGTVDGSNGTVHAAHPGTLQNTGITTTTYIVPPLTTLTMGGTDISSSVIGITAEVQNGIEWNRHQTVHGALDATNASNSQFPENFYISTRIFGGTIVKYLEDNSSTAQTWNSNTPLVMKATTRSELSEGKVTGISITNAGNGYSSPPVVTISGGGGSGATAVASISGSSVSGITITNGGSLYSSAPTVTIAETGWGGSGTRATATATVNAIVTTTYGLEFDITNSSFTNRVKTPDAFREEYNWRMTQNPTTLASVLKYNPTT